MGKLTRTAIILSAVAAILSVGVLSVIWFAWDPLLPFAIWLASMSWFDVALLVLLAITALGVATALVAAIVAPSKRSHLTLEQDGGHVEITKDAIRSTATRIIEARHGMTCKRVGVSIRGRRNPRIAIRAKVDPSTNANLAELGLAMQREVAEGICTFAGYPTERVDIAFTSTTSASAATHSAHAATVRTTNTPVTNAS